MSNRWAWGASKCSIRSRQCCSSSIIAMLLTMSLRYCSLKFRQKGEPDLHPGPSLLPIPDQQGGPTPLFPVEHLQTVLGDGQAIGPFVRPPVVAPGATPPIILHYTDQAVAHFLDVHQNMARGLLVDEPVPDAVLQKRL